MGLWERTRKNHGLEHATISLLLQHITPNRVFAGYSIPAGFFVLGDVPTEAVEQYANEALARMKAGEADLAVSPFCGTNLVVAAALTTVGTLGALRFAGRGPRGWARAFSNAMWALVASRPLGRLVQKHYTTSGDVHDVTIQGVSRHQFGKLVVHWVSTAVDG